MGPEYNESEEQSKGQGAVHQSHACLALPHLAPRTGRAQSPLHALLVELDAPVVPVLRVVSD